MNRHALLLSRKPGSRSSLSSIKKLIIGLVILLFYNFYITFDAPSDVSNVNNRHYWYPENPWEPPPENLFMKDETGSKKNCTGFSAHSVNSRRHKDSGTIVISCHEIAYRAPKSAFQNTGDFIIGVLSAANGTGPERRRYIRETWGYQFKGLLFLVAGPWDQVESEYNDFQVSREVTIIITSLIN